MIVCFHLATFLAMNISSLPSGRDTCGILRVNWLSVWLTCNYFYLVFLEVSPRNYEVWLTQTSNSFAAFFERVQTADLCFWREQKKKTFWLQDLPFLELLKTVVRLWRQDLFLVYQTSDFWVVSKFCVESLSRNFAVFLIAYTVSQLLMHILIHWLTP